MTSSKSGLILSAELVRRIGIVSPPNHFNQYPPFSPLSHPVWASGPAPGRQIPPVDYGSLRRSTWSPEHQVLLELSYRHVVPEEAELEAPVVVMRVARFTLPSTDLFADPVQTLDRVTAELSRAISHWMESPADSRYYINGLPWIEVLNREDLIGLIRTNLRQLLINTLEQLEAEQSIPAAAYGTEQEGPNQFAFHSNRPSSFGAQESVKANVHAPVPDVTRDEIQTFDASEGEQGNSEQ